MNLFACAVLHGCRARWSPNTIQYLFNRIWRTRHAEQTIDFSARDICFGIFHKCGAGQRQAAQRISKLGCVGRRKADEFNGNLLSKSSLRLQRFPLLLSSKVWLDQKTNIQMLLSALKRSGLTGVVKFELRHVLICFQRHVSSRHLDCRE